MNMISFQKRSDESNEPDFLSLCFPSHMKHIAPVKNHIQIDDELFVR